MTGRLRQHLEEPSIITFAAEALGLIGAGTQDRELIDAILRAVEDRYPSPFKKIPLAILRIGGPYALRVAEELVNKRTPGMWLDIIGMVEGQDLDAVLRAAVEHGILERLPDPGVIRKTRKFWGEGAVTTRLLKTVLERCGVLCTFDIESGEIPCRHDDLVEELACSSKGRFAPEEVSQTWNQKTEDDDEANYTVEFRFRGRKYSFAAENYREYYDDTAVVKAVNRALADAGFAERFVGLGEGSFLFGVPERIKAFAGKFRIPLLPERDWLPGDPPPR